MQPIQPGSDDVLLARALEFSAWARTHIRMIIAGGVLLALLVGGLIYYRMYRADREARAAAEFVEIEQTMAAGNVPIAVRDLEAFISRYGGTTYAQEAEIALAQIHLQQNEPARAVQVLQDAGTGVRTPLGAQAALLLAAAQQAAGDRDAAVQTYLRVGEQAESRMHQVRALNNAAVLRAEAGDHAGAAELYRRLVELNEPGTMDRQLFEMRQAEAEARAAGG
jgi:predicted negative regulator of RcsB-dependent stress response